MLGSGHFLTMGGGGEGVGAFMGVGQKMLTPLEEEGAKKFHPSSPKNPAHYYSSKGARKMLTPLEGGLKIFLTHEHMKKSTTP